MNITDLIEKTLEDADTLCQLPTRERVNNRVERNNIAKAGILKRIHVNQPLIKSNHANHEYAPVLTIKTSGANLKGHRAAIVDKKGNEIAVFEYREDDPLSCGARVWVETKYAVVVTEYENVYPEKLPEFRT